LKTIFKYIYRTLQFVFVFTLLFVAKNIAGQNEMKVVNDNLNKTLNLSARAEVMEAINYNDLYSPLDTFVGDLTGYGADCALCSGFLGCTSQDVRDGRTIHKDNDYGEVRIVASSRNLPCGSIIRFESKRVSDKPVFAIVLDRGVGGTSIDLLTESELVAGKTIGRSQIKYDLLRKGWEKRGE
jgi:hypothetical protein